MDSIIESRYEMMFETIVSVLITQGQGKEKK